MSRVIRARRSMRRCAATGVIAVFFSACGGSDMSGSMAAPPAAPAITAQPMGESVPMGLSATYSVTATGAQLPYQWSRDGAAIAGATGSSYTPPATAFTDTGQNFTVTVMNAGGSATSAGGGLTVTARAPASGDLRFQQLDAAST